ncbi:hypothetical protein [Niveibacterium sp. SC-1]|uniref:hypothetical protein n=1 Tax=Niveibacterium sp. SC-1 TaxID=3135646 RepID=UPI00311EC271
MLSGLRFETAPPQRAVSPDRTDIACFIGFVARRSGTLLADEQREALRAGGWVNGPWARSPQALESLLQLPVALDSWDAFARLFAWEQRPVSASGTARCASLLGAAVRSFFATGGRRAIVIRAGDPFPALETSGGRAANRAARLHALIPAIARPALPSQEALPFDPGDPWLWRGTDHLYALGEVSHVCLPDLPDVCAADPLPPPTAFTPAPPPEVFVECSEDEPALPGDDGLRGVQAPRCDEAGFIAWRDAALEVCSFLTRWSLDMLFVGALPLALADARHDEAAIRTHAESRLLDFLRGVGVLESATAPGDGTGTLGAHFAQIVWPWLRTTRSDDLPESLEPADGVFAGLLARNALLRGTFRSVGGVVLDDVVGLTPLPAAGLGPGNPTEALAERLCVIAPEPEGRTVISDVVSTVDIALRFGGSRRLILAIRRSARRFGEVHCFEPNGPALWATLRRSFEDMLSAFWREGAFAGANAEEAYSVRCDRSTMSQDDLDNGRLIAYVTVLPAAAITRITVVLDMSVGAGAGAQVREVA